VSVRHYIRVVPDIYARKALGDCEGKHPPYPPEAVVAYLGCLCLAETQQPRGRFRNRKVLEGELEGSGAGAEYAGWVQFLIDNGDLIEQDDRTIYVEGWDEMQEGDWTVGERMRRYRSRRSPQPVRVDDGDADPANVYWNLTGRYPSDKARRWIDDLIDRFGSDRTRAAIAAAAEQGTENLLGRASDSLKAGERAAERQEREEETRKVAEQRKSGVNPSLLSARHNSGQHAGQPAQGCPYCVAVPA
jgi:hypothetical protein